MVARASRPRMRDLWGVAAHGGFFDDYDPKAPPDEIDKYRVEQGVATYKIAPPAIPLPETLASEIPSQTTSTPAKSPRRKR